MNWNTPKLSDSMTDALADAAMEQADDPQPNTTTRRLYVLTITDNEEPSRECDTTTEVLSLTDEELKQVNQYLAERRAAYDDYDNGIETDDAGVITEECLAEEPPCRDFDYDLSPVREILSTLDTIKERINQIVTL